MKYFPKFLTILILIITLFISWEIAGRVLTGKDDINIVSLLVIGVLGLAALAAYAVDYIERKMKNVK